MKRLDPAYEELDESLEDFLLNVSLIAESPERRHHFMANHSINTPPHSSNSPAP